MKLLMHSTMILLFAISSANAMAVGQGATINVKEATAYTVWEPIEVDVTISSRSSKSESELEMVSEEGVAGDFFYMRLPGSKNSLHSLILNGVQTTSYLTTYRFVFLPLKSGDLVIPSFGSIVGKAGMNTQPVSVSVRRGRREGLHKLCSCPATSAEDLEAILATGENINEADTHGRTPLMWACRWIIDPEVIDFLIKSGADVNAANLKGGTALMFASKNWNPEITATLLRNKANVNARDLGGITPLMAASKWASGTEILALLIGAGADVNERDLGTWTPLMHAVGRTGQDQKEMFELIQAKKEGIHSGEPNAEIVSFLIQRGANPNVLTNKGLTRSGNIEDNITPMMHAAKWSSDPEVIVLLHKSGGSVNSTDIDGTTPLLVASRHNVREVVSVLIDFGALVNKSHRSGWTPLMYAAAHNSPDVIDVLVEAGALIDAEQNDGTTALMCACSPTANSDALWRLLHHGAKVNVKGKFAQTALAIASQGRSASDVELLVSAGANVDAKAIQGMTAVMHAAANNDDPGVVNALVRGGASLSERAPNAWTPLMFACGSNSHDMVHELIQLGADVHAKDKTGWTPIYFAIESNENIEVHRALINAGAVVNSRDRGGWTPLMYAVGLGPNPQVVSLLLEHGADANVKSPEGKTALQYAPLNSKLSGTEALAKLKKATK